ncbi:glycine cleavage system protein H [Arachnia propionica]|uniref:Glycine cleavage system H protein n=1 Tax=Arachnia propionica TaxID=1750 RepID=A0A3P1T718_9ACTN|nr:glycine cleavage system H protein [Arachnia propionica]MDO5083483.1 glycine cleavage system H protein [Arachnia propionica]RRD04965.1 glycine cleavage system protein H [Arachnia propionica]
MLKYTEEHEWLAIEGDRVTVGLTPHATEQLQDIVYVELPEVDAEVTKGEELVVLDSTKATFGINAPADGVVTAVNQAVTDDPESVIADPENVWFFTMTVTDPSVLEEYLDAAAYEALIG